MAPVASNDHNRSDGDKQPLQYKGNSPFQATIEIISGTKLTYNIASTLMNSLAANRVDTHAFTVCLKIGKALDWSPEGRNRFHYAMENLGVVSAWERILQFGFRWEGPMGGILKLEDGERFAALTACLTEIYKDGIVAEIYIELLKIIVERNKDDPCLKDVFIPSKLQLESVVKRFAGIFSTSQYATSVEDYMSMDNHGVVTGGTQTKKRSTRDATSRTIAYPECIAKALYELLELSRDGSKTQQVVLVGGADAPAIAAIGRWLIDLPTKVYREVNSVKVDATGPELQSEGKPRVIVVFSEDPQKSETSNLRQARVVLLHQVKDIIKNNKSPNPEPVVAGRCRWNNVLFRTFGDSFRSLVHGMHVQFASALGCAARVFQALAQGDETLPHQWLVGCQTYVSTSFGPDYIFFALDRFPELQSALRKVNPQMQERVRLPYREAQAQLEDSLSNISMVCRCKVCWLNGEAQPRESKVTPDDRQTSKEWYCLTALATTIIRLVRVLSVIDLIDEKLLLKREGIEWFYNQQALRHQRHRQMTKTHTNARDELYVTRILDFARLDKSAPEFSPLAVAIALYSGDQRYSDLEPDTSAFVSQGICAYLRILEDPSHDARRVSRVCVIPGCIEFNERRYGGIQDFGFDPFQNTQSNFKTETRPNHCISESTQRLARICVSRCSNDMKLCVRERLDHSLLPWLEVGFSVTESNREVLEWLGPARAVGNITRGTGLTMCDPSRCRDSDKVEKALKDILPSGSPTASNYEVFKSGDMEAFIFRGDTTTAFIAACGCWLPIFLTESNCVKCAIHTGIRNSWRTFAIVCSERSFMQTSSIETKKLLDAADLRIV
ncbi:hypothetical protein ACLMJK_006227 [Lecanora helva]